MRNVTRALVGVIVASFVAAVSVCAQTPTEADFGACNTEGRAAMKAGTTKKRLAMLSPEHAPMGLNFFSRNEIGSCS